MNFIYPCQDYLEVTSLDEVMNLALKSGHDDWFLQPKQDGIWARVVIYRGNAEIYSKTGQLKDRKPVPLCLVDPREPMVLIGEFMFGSQWAQHPDRRGRLFIFDCVMLNGEDISMHAYKHRYRQAQSAVLQLGQVFNLVPCYPLSKASDLHAQGQGKFEGWIFRRWLSSYLENLYKLKYEVEDDFVVIGMVEGKGKHKGRMGALQLGQYHNGALQYVQDCGGGFTDIDREIWWAGRNAVSQPVVLIRGKGRFASGALRHPEFIRVRDDKKPTECLLKSESR